MGDELRSFAIVTAGGALMIAAAMIADAAFKIRAFDRLAFGVRDVVVGVIAVAPLAGLLFLFMRTRVRALAQFRDSQVDFFSEIGFSFTWPRIIVIGALAGFSEELLFRGVLQPLADRAIPLAAALVLTNVVFGLLHARTAFYALIAGCVGIYLGILFAITGNLLAPMITHGLYDIVALAVTRRAISRRRKVALHEPRP